MNILEVKNVNKHFGGLHAVRDCSFDIEANTIVGLIGPNGAGKTTLFNLLTGVIPVDSGEIHFEGENVTKLPTFLRAKKGIARTFQVIRLFPELTVLENVLVSLKGNVQSLWKFWKNHSKEHEYLTAKAHEYLRRVGLNAKTNHKAKEVSYGQQKLLEIICRIACEGELILLDEPAAGVNPTMLRSVVDLIKGLHREGKTFLIIEHDMGFIMNISHRIIALDFGHVIAEGTPSEIQKNEKVLSTYLGG